MTLFSPLKVLFPVLALALILTGCSPHPGAGTWQAKSDNDLGIKQLIVHFNGRADFSITKPEKSDMHCFWGATDENTSALQCTSSLNPDKEVSYTLSIEGGGIAELSQNGTVIATFNKIKDQ